MPQQSRIPARLLMIVSKQPVTTTATLDLLAAHTLLTMDADPKQAIRLDVIGNATAVIVEISVFI